MTKPVKRSGVQLRSGQEPVLYLQDPEGMDSVSRRKMLDRIAQLNHLQETEFGDPEITTRIAQYEMAYRMQTSVPGVMDFSNESESTYKLYGADSLKPGTFASNCLLARRLSERGVRFVQLYHMGWDAHYDLPGMTSRLAKDTGSLPVLLLAEAVYLKSKSTYQNLQ